MKKSKIKRSLGEHLAIGLMFFLLGAMYGSHVTRAISHRQGCLAASLKLCRMNSEFCANAIQEKLYSFCSPEEK